MGKNRSSRQAMDLVDTGGHSASGHGSLNAVSDCRRMWLAASATSEGETS